uniref:TTF-type domain-containing protein n=1 Tax=Leptobrachium leishanense TaxID=445787 RepID=A0A8C5ME33_9ANUR
MDIRSYYSSLTKKQASDSAAEKEQQDESQLSKHPDVEIEYVEIDSPESDFYFAEEEDEEDPELLPPVDESSLPSTSSHKYSAHGESCDYDQSLVHRPTGGIKSKPPGPCDISQCATEGPKQPILKKYQQKKIGASFRSFRPQWFKSFNWLEYSISQDAAYCFSCRFFSVSKYIHGEMKKVPFVNVGFSNWKNAMENEKGIPQHEKSTSHKESCVSWQDFKRNEEKDTTIMKGLSKAHAREVEENRHYIKTIAEVLLLTAKNKIAQREHRCNSDDLNHGNVREILYLIAKKDRIVEKKLNGPRNARYLHPSIQNELLAVMASLVREEIADSLKDSPFSILADETKDRSKAEQLSVVVRYFYDQAVHERFLKFYKADSLDAASLTDYIFDVLSSLGIDKNECVGQAYDGAAVMSGRINGVQARIQRKVPTALYVHCMNHRLNLAVVDTVKNVAEAAEFFAKLEKLYVFSSTSVVHSVFERVQKEMSTKPVIKLKQLSDTRWTCQYAACKAVLQTLEPLLETLKLLSDGKNTERRIE